MKIVSIAILLTFINASATEILKDQSAVSIQGVLEYTKGTGPDTDERIIKYTSLKLCNRAIVKDVQIDGDEFQIDSIQLIFNDNQKDYNLFSKNINKSATVSGKFIYATTSRFSLPNCAKLYVNKISNIHGDNCVHDGSMSTNISAQKKNEIITSKRNSSSRDSAVDGFEKNRDQNSYYTQNDNSSAATNKFPASSRVGWGTGNGGERSGKMALGAGSMQKGIKNRSIAVVPQESDLVITNNANLRSKESILRVLRQHVGGFRYSYERFSEEDPNLCGTLVLKFTVKSTGDISEVELHNSKTGIERLDNEILSKASRLKFEQIDNGDVTFIFTTQCLNKKCQINGTHGNDIVKPVSKSEIVRIIPNEQLKNFKKYLTEKLSTIDARYQDDIVRLSHKIDLISNISNECNHNNGSINGKISCVESVDVQYVEFLKEFYKFTIPYYDKRLSDIASISAKRAAIGACAVETESFLNPLFSSFNRRVYSIGDLKTVPFDDDKSIATWNIIKENESWIVAALDERLNKWQSACKPIIADAEKPDAEWNPYFVSKLDSFLKGTEFNRDQMSIYSIVRWKQVISINDIPTSVQEDNENGIEYIDPDRRWNGEITGKTKIHGDSAKVFIDYIRIEDVKEHKKYVERG